MVRILSSLFTPIRIRQVELKNRIVMTPVVTHLSEASEIDFYVSRARGGAGLIQLPPGIIDQASDNGVVLPLWDDRSVPRLARIVEAVHSAGSMVSIQLFHAGRQLESACTGSPIVAPSPIPWSRSAEIPRELSIQEIRELVQKFARAAKRARSAGVDFVEVHAAHGYLLSEFLSPLSNKRTDEYGGDLKGRTRFIVEIIKRIKEELGGDFLVSCRINGADNIAGGLTLDEAKTIAPILVDAGLDLISVSAGMFGSYPTIVPPFDMPQGCNVPLAEGVKNVVNVPVIVAGRITDPNLAEEILQDGKADLIGMARALIADPKLPSKAAKGQFEEICKCIACNTCIDFVDIGPILCTVNSAAGRESELEIVPAVRKKRVLVIGGGVAGLEAARIARLRGHQVSLYEKERHLGGQWLLAAAPPHKQEFVELIKHESRQLKKLGVRVQLGKAVSVSLVRRQKPDVVIVATGALPLELPTSRIQSVKVVASWDILRGKSRVGGSVLVVGGGSGGLETAHFLAEQGNKVTIIEMLGRIGADMGATGRWHLLNRLKQHDVTMFRSTKLKRVNKQEIVVLRNDSEEVWTGFDTIVIAIGSKSSNKLAAALTGVVEEIHVIGDAIQPRKGVDAIREGAEIGCRI